KRSQLTVIASSADTLRFLRAGRTDTPYGRFTVDLALVEGDEAYAALKGTGSQDGLRLLTLLPAQYLHIATLSGSPIRSIGELKGKAVSVGPARSRSEKLTLRLLEALDPSVGASLQRAALGLSESMWALAEKDIRVVGTQNLLISRLDLPVQLAHDIVKTLDSHPDAFTGGDRRLSDISAGPDTYMPFPVHPGALKFRADQAGTVTEGR